MRAAIVLAEAAAQEGEVPVGAVIARDGEIISGGRNRREKGKNALYHAEIEAIDKACRALGGWRLPGCELYVTLEPCPMCAGAIINARIERVFFGAYDRKFGALTSAARLFELPGIYSPAAVGGLLEEDCAALLSSFFKNLRAAKKI